MNKIQEIFRAWGIALKPNDAQSAHAARRLSVCEVCEWKRDTPVRHCSVCGCALRAKIFTPKRDGACPKGKWDAVDAE